jgi:hypothetical protein
MEQSPSWESDSLSSVQEIPSFYGTQRFITVFTEVATEPHPELTEFNPYKHTIFLYDQF